MALLSVGCYVWGLLLMEKAKRISGTVGTSNDLFYLGIILDYLFSLISLPPATPQGSPHACPPPAGPPTPTQWLPAESLPAAHRPWRSGRIQTWPGLLGRVPHGPPAHSHQGGAPTCSAATSSFVSTAASPALPCSAATWWKKRLHLVSTSENCS